MCVGESVTRSYTPICSSDALTRHTPPAHAEGQSIDLMVKLYDNGKMSRFLSNLSIGEYLSAMFAYFYNNLWLFEHGIRDQVAPSPSMG